MKGTYKFSCKHLAELDPPRNEQGRCEASWILDRIARPCPECAQNAVIRTIKQLAQATTKGESACAT